MQVFMRAVLTAGRMARRQSRDWRSTPRRPRADGLTGYLAASAAGRQTSAGPGRIRGGRCLQGGHRGDVSLCCGAYLLIHPPVSPDHPSLAARNGDRRARAWCRRQADQCRWWAGRTARSPIHEDTHTQMITCARPTSRPPAPISNCGCPASATSSKALSSCLVNPQVSELARTLSVLVRMAGRTYPPSHGHMTDRRGY